MLTVKFVREGHTKTVEGTDVDVRDHEKGLASLIVVTKSDGTSRTLLVEKKGRPANPRDPEVDGIYNSAFVENAMGATTHIVKF